MKTLFLPGAGASADFWKPVARCAGLEGVFLSWPGLGHEPARPDVTGLDDLVALVLREMDEPVHMVAQSMGGLIAVRAALAAPHRLARLVLTATSGGIPTTPFGAIDWRPDYYRTYPRAARWLASAGADLSAQIATLRAPTLLLWGDRDAISPLPVGERLAALLPDSRLHVVAGGDHDLAQTHVEEVAAQVRAHLVPGS